MLDLHAVGQKGPKCVPGKERKGYLVQVFSRVLNKLAGSRPSCSILTGKREHVKDTHNMAYIWLICKGPVTVYGIYVKIKQHSRGMLLSNVLLGQCINPTSVCSTFCCDKFCGCASSKYFKSINVRYGTAGSLDCASWKPALAVRSVNSILAKKCAWLVVGIRNTNGGIGRMPENNGAITVHPVMERPGPVKESPPLEDLVKENQIESVEQKLGSDISVSNGRDDSLCCTSQECSSHGKKAINNYSVIGIPGDGRCLFRAIVYGAQVIKDNCALNEKLQREYADDLRQKVVDELVSRRAETEWFIEGNFDTYTERMRKPHVWGGEPELLMASHVLRMPITVYISEQRQPSRGIIPIAEYGQEYLKERLVVLDGLVHRPLTKVIKDNCALNEKLQREYADDLRQKVVDELVSRRAETEWFIEGNFDTYTERMQKPHVWSG